MSKSPTTRERWHRVEEILDEALELAPDEVPAFLDRACTGDGELRAMVEKLLAADRQAAGQGFLGSPAEETAGSLLGEDAETLADGGLLAPGMENRTIGPYEILRRLAAGGMGVVYLARDRRLQRTVALKLLPPDWGSSAASRERFLREARLVSALDHPNICTLHDIGETEDGRLFLVMAYYGGETLKAKLERGPLPVDEAVELAVQVGSGLARAHEAGIVHRDIKPANVIVTEHGEAKILDFGIAKLAGEAGLTRTGSSLGTPAYMSPEQARGRAVDARTDIWSLGVLLYEMITGRRPFAAEHPQAQIHAILREEPAPVSQLRPGLPPPVVRVVGKAMAKDPDRRYQTVDELISELSACTGPQALAAAAHRRHWRALLAAGVAVAVLLALAGWWLFRVLPGGRAADPTAAPGAAGAVAVPVVGVLPFANRTGDAALDWYGEGVARLARDSLSSSSHLQVVSELRVEPLLALADEGERVRRAAADGITALLSGEILPGAQGLTLAARVVETRSGRQLAARRLDGLAPKDLLQASDEIALAAREALNVPLEESVDLFVADAAENPQAYEAYIAGLREFAAKRYEEAEHGFATALQKAPGFTMARFRLAHTLAVTGRTDEALVEIRKAVFEADRLPDRDARLVRALAAYIARDYDDALAAYAEITRLYPYEVEARYFRALVLKNSQRYDEALAQIAILTRLEPENPSFWDLSGGTHLARGNLYQAVQDYLRLRSLSPRSADAHKVLGDAYRAQGELTLAAGSYAEALRLDPQLHSATVALAVTDFLRGQGEAAENRLARLAANAEASPRARLDAAFELASLLRAQGRFRRAAAMLADLEDLAATEKIREALALSVRGTSLLEVGDRAAARPLLERAVQRAPGAPPTRYLFTRGLLELEERRLADLEETISQILAGAPPAANSNRKEEKAAACLRGMRELEEGRPLAAVEEFARAVTLQGFEYTSSKLWLARAYLAAGRLPEALAAAHEATQREKAADPRLDLEVDRIRALLVLAQVHAAMGHPEDASAPASQVLERWQGADPDLPDLAAARRLAAG